MFTSNWVSVELCIRFVLDFDIDFTFYPFNVFLILFAHGICSHILNCVLLLCIVHVFPRRSMHVLRMGATCFESTVPRYVNTWSTSSTSLNTCRKSTWWTVYWRTSLSYRWVCGGGGAWVWTSVCLYVLLLNPDLHNVFLFLLLGGVQQRNSGDSAVHCLCVWSVH